MGHFALYARSLVPAGEHTGLRDAPSGSVLRFRQNGAAVQKYYHLLQGGTVSIPAEISGQKYICLTTFRKNGVPARTPLWFAEAGDMLVFMTRNDSGKYKRIRNNPKVLVAPCTMRGRVTGPEFQGTVRILPPSQWPSAKRLINRKYWLARLPIWSTKNEFLEIKVSG